MLILHGNRKNIPAYQLVDQIDIARLLACAQELDLLNRVNWHKLNYQDDVGGKFANITATHSSYYSDWFQFRTGKYQDLFLNEIDYELINSVSQEQFDSKRSRVRVIRDPELMRQQNNAEFIFKSQLKSLYRNTYLETVYNQISQRFPGGAGRAKIGYMAAGTAVENHIDADSAVILKVHIPLITDPAVMFYVRYQAQWQSYHMPADGSAILLNVGLPHRVENPSLIDRYHLIINIYTQ